MSPKARCRVCQTLSEAIRAGLENNRPRFRDGWALPGVPELCHSDCPTHVPFFESLLSHTGMTASDEFPFFQLDLVYFIDQYRIISLTISQVGHSTQGTFEYGNTRNTRNIDMTQSEFLVEHHSSRKAPSDIGRARRLQEYIDLDLVNRWMRRCDEAHGDSCRPRPLDWRPGGFKLAWLIDVEQLCLVSAPENARYVALSYVWGNVPMLKTLETNLPNHRKPGAFKIVSDSAIHVPTTIRNAISLTSRLKGDIKYLWVDSLCIVQDDQHSLAEHIQHMALVYGAAVLTIVAADGPDANQELKGLQGISSPRPVAPALKLADDLILRYVLRTRVGDSNWAKRGWTFQEGIFSLRALIFFENSVRWVCQQFSGREEVLNLLPSPLSDIAMIRGLDFSYPNLETLANLVGGFNSRLFTYQEDVMSAITSTLNTLRRAYPAGFVFGLPVSYLDCFLLWANKESGKGRPRKASSPEGAHTLPPSWSWAGWKGLSSDIRGNTNSAMLSFRGGAHNETISMLDWSICKSLNSPPVRIPRQNEWYDFRLRYMGMQEELPPGWKYHLDKELIWSQHPEAPEGVYYTHDSMPHEKNGNDESRSAGFSREILELARKYDHTKRHCVKFWQPVPISSEDEDQSAQHLEHGPRYGKYLCARAQTAQLWLGPLDGSKFEIADRHDALIGKLQVDGAYEHELVTSHLLGPEADGSKFACEIVAISRNVSLTGRSIPFEPGKEIFTEYNVLWVVWENGVAFRRGVGQVSRAWDSLDLKDVDLVLG